MPKFKILKSLLLPLLIAIFCTSWTVAASAATATFPDQTLHYVATYKWGLIHKEAGTATLSLRKNGSQYRLTLTGRTKPWADKFFAVRDTLTSIVDASTLRPARYTKRAHEGGYFSYDDVRFTHSGQNVKGALTRRRINKKGEHSENHKTLTAQGATFDMLSVFYYLRTINYAELASKGAIKVNIFSGDETETLTIRSLGRQRIKLRDDSYREAWHIRFRFTSHGGRKSSDDIDAWLSTSAQHIPYQIIGKLKIGEVRVYWEPPK